MADMTAAGKSGYGDYETYVADHEDMIPPGEFARYDRIASCMVDFLAGRAVDAGNGAVREAVHWQIWFMRQRGSLGACFDTLPQKESFGGYSIERSAAGDGEKIRLFGLEVSPMMISVLRVGGVISLWI
ncbi:MAG: hypothetical protein E7604_01630 [Ruminococcaceae bacterium]|nr:hypothetical protein [Oscillospiraceae bacterium]